MITEEQVPKEIRWRKMVDKLSDGTRIVFYRQHSIFNSYEVIRYYEENQNIVYIPVGEVSKWRSDNARARKKLKRAMRALLRADGENDSVIAAYKDIKAARKLIAND